MKTFLLSAILVACSGLGMAQPNATCVLTNTCHIVQRSDTQVFTENAPNTCVFTLLDVDTIGILCKHDKHTEDTATVHFLIGQCKQGNFLGSADITWEFCRTSDTVFSWTITDDVTFQRTGTLF